ncbi:hypothetical protein FIU97_14095 [Roseivivax sp. THAF40]|uniref:hypothetical protein n=1 Tax=unclassified Roseivivax TaxID=2639302 RepID=UPI0012679FE5|nr:MULTISPECIES: hypothetical protein [unclassified Roseivivax]QFS83876.1 hypothetical protein FIV09_13655 [Roseivivax sp. THAF197b]QFT47708.1 hypothetical protein FIU97_14095 [Roseivivax sp. THAF40]
MMMMLSFAANLAIGLLALWGLWRGVPDMRGALGPDSPSRRLLAAILATLVCASIAGLGRPDKAAEIAHTLFPLQILATLIALPLLGLKARAAQIAGALALLHLVTMVTLYS